MLALTRHRQERIFIGPEIVITVLEIDQGRVRIGIEAPDGYRICREEIAPPDWIQTPKENA